MAQSVAPIRLGITYFFPFSPRLIELILRPLRAPLSRQVHRPLLAAKRPALFRGAAWLTPCWQAMRAQPGLQTIDAVSSALRLCTRSPLPVPRESASSLLCRQTVRLRPWFASILHYRAFPTVWEKDIPCRAHPALRIRLNSKSRPP